MADIRFKYGLDSNFKDIDKTKEQEGTIFLSQVAKEINSTQTPYKSHLYFLDSNKNMLNIVPKLLDVENGGTGRTTLELDQVLLGNGIEPIKFRPITDFLTANTGYTLNDTNNLITERTIGHWNGEFDEQKLDESGNIITVKKYYLTKLGVINTGTWEANVIKSIYGGTGNNSYTKNRLIYTKENNASEIQLLSSNHFIDDNKIIFYYNPDKEDTIYKNKDELNKEFKFLVDGAVQFITSDDYESIFKFTNGQLTMEQKNVSPIKKVLDIIDVTPTLVFYNKTDDKKGILKWGRIGDDHQIDILAFLSDSIDFALSTPKLEVNTLSHFNSEKDTRHNVLHFLNENDNVRVVLNGQGSTFITSGSTSFTQDKVLSENEEEQKNLYLASNHKIYFYINNNDEDTKSLDPEHFIVLDQGKALYPDINATGELGTDTNNWNAIKALNLISNTNLNIAATAKDEILDSGNIHLSADTDKLINLNSDSYITNYKDLILTGDIVYHNLNVDFSYKHSAIRFLAGNTLRDGISFGGGGAIAIESGNLNFLEPRLFLDLNTGSLINGNSERGGEAGQDGNIYIASEDKIYIYPSRSSTGNQELSHYLIIDNKVIQPDLDDEWKLGTYDQNLNNLYSRAITANNDLIIKSGIRGGEAPQPGNINITAGNESNVTLTGDLIKIVGDLYLYNSIKYHNNNNPLTMIQFSDGTVNGAGIAIGGKGSVFIAAGESIDNTSLGVQTGNYDSMYLASDGNIELFTNAQPESDHKKTTLDSSGNFILNSTSRGYYLTDSSEFQYPGIYDNGANLWIGATQKKSTHHTGTTYISTGYNGSQGNETIYVTVPNTTNTDGSNYKVFHENMIVPVTSGGTGKGSWTQNRLIWTSSNTSLSDSGHYVSSTNIAINSTSAPVNNFYVNGTSRLGHAYFYTEKSPNQILNEEGQLFSPICNILELKSNHYTGSGDPETNGGLLHEVRYGDGGPQIRFTSAQDNQTIALHYTAFNNVSQSGATLSLVSTEGSAIFATPRLRTSTIQSLDYLNLCPGINTIAGPKNDTQRIKVAVSDVPNSTDNRVAQFTRLGSSGMWWHGRDNVLLRETSAPTSWHPLISFKTPNGSWEFGNYNSGNFAEGLSFAYVTDDCYDDKSNTSGKHLHAAGLLKGGAFYTANYGPDAPGSSTPGAGVSGALYFRIV